MVRLVYSIIIENGPFCVQMFCLGLFFGAVLKVSPAHAVDLAPQVATTPGGPPGAAPLPCGTKCTSGQLLALGLVCSATVKCGEGGINWAQKAMVEKSIQQPKLAVIGACLLAAGWCIGRLYDRAAAQVFK